MLYGVLSVVLEMISFVRAPATRAKQRRPRIIQKIAHTLPAGVTGTYRRRGKRGETERAEGSEPPKRQSNVCVFPS